MTGAHASHVSCGELQWGRVQTDAEGRRRASTAPSMPRFNGAASKRTRKAGAGTSCAWTICCFNGAASKRTRKGIHPRGYPGDYCSFNGAASKRTRKDVPPHGGRSTRLSFNGAASKRTRKESASANDSDVATSFNGAASKRTRKDNPDDLRCKPSAASMGPRPNGRGRKPVTSKHRPAVLLQWGRVQTDAEGRGHSASPGFRRRSFNGAASKRTRKAPDARHGDQPARLLQWGRVQTDAEGGLGCVDGEQGVELQWGRVQTDAEGICLGIWDAHRRAASMGPRPNGRGRYVPDRRDAQLQNGFNGAASKRTRKEAARALLNLNVLRFNGAASKRTRKGLARFPGLRRPPASMGPRPNGRGRIAITIAFLIAPAVLQWGRVQTDAEGVRKRRPCGSPSMLQWGRVQTDAEGGSMRFD